MGPAKPSSGSSPPVPCQLASPFCPPLSPTRPPCWGDRLRAIELLASGGALCVTNVVVFALTYWHADQGGPEARLRALGSRTGVGPRPDWHFPQQDFPELSAPWRPSFLDYLVLA